MVVRTVRMKDPTAIIEAGPGVYFLESDTPVDELVRIADVRGFTVFRLYGNRILDNSGIQLRPFCSAKA